MNCFDNLTRARFTFHDLRTCNSTFISLMQESLPRGRSYLNNGKISMKACSLNVART